MANLHSLVFSRVVYHHGVNDKRLFSFRHVRQWQDESVQVTDRERGKERKPSARDRGTGVALKGKGLDYSLKRFILFFDFLL